MQYPKAVLADCFGANLRFARVVLLAGVVHLLIGRLIAGGHATLSAHRSQKEKKTEMTGKKVLVSCLTGLLLGIFNYYDEMHLDTVARYCMGSRPVLRATDAGRGGGDSR